VFFRETYAFLPPATCRARTIFPRHTNHVYKSQTIMGAKAAYVCSWAKRATLVDGLPALKTAACCASGSGGGVVNPLLPPLHVSLPAVLDCSSIELGEQIIGDLNRDSCGSRYYLFFDVDQWRSFFPVPWLLIPFGQFGCNGFHHRIPFYVNKEIPST
jgi:hypothetical protein